MGKTDHGPKINKTCERQDCVKSHCCKHTHARTPNYAMSHAQTNLVRLATASEVIGDTNTRVVGRQFEAAV